ncbi:MAG TPA: FMN-binding negative transcriptional regulator [Chitinophagaceae bacterium]|nr:FMN-binding negative transcriptional regulator [Chitinophagaceae bacterium]HNK61367.1 FMN-binding negative transcriptional regulator [Chitinophagaceae bacterium]HNO55869.1 FMN-binding negative transcriptional regulator [Chitinophagaceae bacterium]
MYSFPYYKVTDKEEVIAFMKAHPFITLLGTDKSGRIEATQVPVLVDVVGDKIYISGHIMRKTTHENALIENPDALIIFTGSHAYVSATYYTTNPHQGSTWNYIAIHARGKIRWMDEQGLISFMSKLTLHFEKNNSASSTVYDNLPEEYVSKLIKGIAGFEMEVAELDNVFKLSQNRDEVSYDNIVKELKQQAGDAKVIGELMEQRKSKYFHK